MRNIYVKFKSFVKESIDSENLPVITIEKIKPDERSPKRKGAVRYSVNYQIQANSNLMEISGTLEPHHTGRALEYTFEPSYMEDVVDAYYSENWERIEDEIIDEFYKEKR